MISEEAEWFCGCVGLSMCAYYQLLKMEKEGEGGPGKDRLENIQKFIHYVMVRDFVPLFLVGKSLTFCCQHLSKTFVRQNINTKDGL